MFEQLHWLPLSACIQLKILILIFRPNAFLPINLRCLCPHITRLIDITFWFPVLELQCQSLDRLHQLVPLFAMRCFLLLFCYTLLSGSFFFFSNPASSVSILHTASASLWFFLHGALYVWIQYIWLIWACLDGFRKLKLLSAFVLLQQTGKYSIQKTILPDYLYSTVLAEAVRWELLSILSAMDVPLPNRRWSLLYVFN